MSKECCEQCKDFSGCSIRTSGDNCCLICSDFYDCHPVGDLSIGSSPETFAE